MVRKNQEKTVETTYSRYGLSTHEDEARGKLGFPRSGDNSPSPVFVPDGEVQGHQLVDSAHPDGGEL
jgi:hypothetical protein